MQNTTSKLPGSLFSKSAITLDDNDADDSEGGGFPVYFKPENEQRH